MSRQSKGETVMFRKIAAWFHRPTVDTWRPVTYVPFDNGMGEY
jgi:hypothetical protein